MREDFTAETRRARRLRGGNYSAFATNCMNFTNDSEKIRAIREIRGKNLLLA